ncbi:MAG: hypothetical protein A2Y14_01185 [Verrucomicrobia bacterium GWF2_51_19]|nr:MAG: hypothetical protein A2Y14_01185 [Verrucomicrobia bacterium GWF2_51_19]
MYFLNKKSSFFVINRRDSIQSPKQLHNTAKRSINTAKSLRIGSLWPRMHASRLIFVDYLKLTKDYAAPKIFTKKLDFL